jgi:hypothetical protein
VCQGVGDDRSANMAAASACAATAKIERANGRRDPGVRAAPLEDARGDDRHRLVNLGQDACANFEQQEANLVPLESG